MSLPDQPTIEQLLAIIHALQEEVRLLRERVAELEAENERLRKQAPPPPPAPKLSDLPHFVKPNRASRTEAEKQREGKKQRRKRDRGYSRPTSVPTRVEEHALDCCPDCGRGLSGGWLHGEREVIDLPPVQRLQAEVVRHRFLRRWCGVCRKAHLPSREETLSCVSSVVVGRHRFGARLMSLVAHLSQVCRMPVRQIARLLGSLFSVCISAGGVAAILAAVAKAGAARYEQLREQVRSSSFVHADETGWREDGMNGYLWSFSTPLVRYFTREPSRAHTVPKAVLGQEYRGILVSDFYSGYSYHLGPHQRCWAHLLRDVRKLQEVFAASNASLRPAQDVPAHAHVQAWAERLHDLYAEATSRCLLRRQDRVRWRERLEQQLLELARPYLGTDAPQAALCERLARFASEMFTFVEHPEVPPDNNAAERAIRPAVILRKVCGGTRSTAGSNTRAVLMSLFGTWQAQERDPLEECRQMLAAGV